MFYKNTANQLLEFYAEDVTTGLPASGEAANITAYISGGSGVFAEPTNTGIYEKGRGFYYFIPSQNETNHDVVSASFDCSNSNVYIAPAIIYTDPDIVTTSTTIDGAIDFQTAIKTLLACTYAGGGGLDGSGVYYNDQSGSEYFKYEVSGNTISVTRAPS